jgi:signal transduction histidine kinase
MSRWSDAALRRAALVMLALFAACVVVAIALAPELDGRALLQHPDANPVDVGFMITGTALAVVGVLLAWLRPRNPIGWLLGLAGVVGAACNTGQIYGALALAAPDKHLPAGYFALAASAPLWIPGLVMPATVVLARFPSGRIPGTWARRFDRAAITGLVLIVVGYANSPNAITDEIRDPSPPHLVPEVVAGVVLVTGAAVFFIGFGGTVVTTIHRMIKAGPTERQPILLLLIATVAAVAGVVFLPTEWLGSVAYALIPIAIAVGVLRYRLLGIDVVIRRTLLYATLTGLVLVVFVAVTAGLAALLPHGPAPIVVAASLIAVGLAPVRDRVQRIVDRVVYGDRDDPWSALLRLSSPLGGPADAALLDATAEALGTALRVPGVEIRDEAGQPLAQWGEVSAGHDVALQFAGEPQGSIVVGARRGESSLAAADLRLLTAVAPLVAVVVHALALTVELRTAQDRLRETTEAERNRLRQDLHDSLGPSLTGIGLGLEALESTSGPRADAMLARLREEVARSLDEVRRIIDDLRPGALDDDGLLEALRSRVTHLRQRSGLRLELDAPYSLNVSPEVEVAAYRIVEEALTNVMKHARATYCSIRLTVDDRLRVVVLDDGVGLVAANGSNGANGSGVGMRSMRERAERVGGRFTASDCAPGTEICADFPLEPA